MSAAPARAFGAGAAVTVLVAIPLLMAPAKPEEPKAATTALTLELARTPYVVAIPAPDPAPGPAVLRDVTGRFTTNVTPEPDDCRPTSTRVAFAGQQDSSWCLDLGEVPAGHELTGEVSNGRDRLTLTVRRRDAFFPGPFSVLVLGLVTGLLVALVPRWLRGVVRWLVLNRMIAGHPEIGGLQEWVQERRLRGDTRESLIAAIHKVTGNGPVLAAQARRRLRDAIDALHASLLQHDLVVAADAVAKADVDKMSDFYSGGEERKVHPADEWAAAVEQLASYRAELDAQKRAIGRIGAGNELAAEQALKVAEERFAALKTPAELPTMVPRLDRLRDAVDLGLALSRPAGGGFRPAGVGGAVAPQARRSRLETVIPLGLSAGTLGGWIWIARIATGLLAALALLFAFVTLKQSGYDAKPLFDSGADYLALFAAGLGSGAGATLLALAGNWRPVASEDDEA